MLICCYLNTFPNTFWGDGIWYFKYQILLASVIAIHVYHPNMLDEVLSHMQTFRNFASFIHFHTKFTFSSPSGFSVISNSKKVMLR